MGLSSSRPQTSTRKRNSEVWQFYDIIEIPIKRTRIVCKKCKIDFSCQTSGGTGHLKKHADKHTTSQNDPTQAQISFSSSNIGTFVFNNKNARKKIAKFIVQVEQSFYLAENPAFIKVLLKGFNSNFKSISRTTMRKYRFIIYGEYKGNLISKISKGSFEISFIYDIWCSQNNSDCLCGTTHYIDNNWILQKRILSFIELEYQHTTSNIAGYIMHIINEYKIEKFIFSVTFYNASASNTTIEILKM